MNEFVDKRTTGKEKIDAIENLTGLKMGVAEATQTGVIHFTMFDKNRKLGDQWIVMDQGQLDLTRKNGIVMINIGKAY